MQFDTLKGFLYYSAIFSFALLEEDMQQAVILNVGGAQVYLIDVFYMAAIAGFIAAIMKRRIRGLPLEGQVYVGFIIWLIFSVAVGLPAHGYRALGEARYVLPLFAFFIPLVMFRTSMPDSERRLRATIRRTIYVSASASIVAFLLALVRLWWGVSGQEEGDFRGIRFITGNQTFYLLLLVTWLTIRAVEIGSVTVRQVAAAGLALTLAIVSKNRTPFISIGLGLFAYLLASMQIRRLLVAAGLVFILVWGLSVTFPDLGEELQVAYGGILSPEEDPTGQWRIGIQLAALDQALETPWMGQGFGGYFSFIGPGLEGDVEYDAPPHNQFIMLLLKTGTIGVALSVVTIAMISLRAVKLVKGLKGNVEAATTSLTLLLLVSTHFVYGMAYDFFPFFGLYAGLAICYFTTLSSTPRATT